jgi:hypothetical protein
MDYMDIGFSRAKNILDLSCRIEKAGGPKNILTNLCPYTIDPCQVKRVSIGRRPQSVYHFI